MNFEEDNSTYNSGLNTDLLKQVTFLCRQETQFPVHKGLVIGGQRVRNGSQKRQTSLILLMFVLVHSLTRLSSTTSNP